MLEQHIVIIELCNKHNLIFYSYRTAALAKYLYENMQIGWFSFAEIANKTGMMKEDIIPTLANMGIIPKRMGRPITEDKLRRIIEEMKPKFEARRWISMEKLDFEVPATKPKDAPKIPKSVPYPLRSRNKPAV